MFVFGYFLMKNIKCYAAHKRKWTSMRFIHWGPIMENFWRKKTCLSWAGWKTTHLKLLWLSHKKNLCLSVESGSES